MSDIEDRTRADQTTAHPQCAADEHCPRPGAGPRTRCWFHDLNQPALSAEQRAVLEADHFFLRKPLGW